MGYFWIINNVVHIFFPQRRINESMTMISTARLDRDGCTVFTTRWCNDVLVWCWTDPEVWLDSRFRLPLVFRLVVIPLIASHPSSNSLTLLIKSPRGSRSLYQSMKWFRMNRQLALIQWFHWTAPGPRTNPGRPGWWNLTWMILKIANKPSQHFAAMSLCVSVSKSCSKAADHTCMVVSRYWMSR